jgi:hypothetical protein
MMFEYEVFPDHTYPHQFKFAWEPRAEDFHTCIDWCFDRLTEDLDNVRWTYWTIDRTISIVRPDDALQFWMRWK